MTKNFVIEQINVSDNEYQITSVNFSSGAAVKKGDIIFSYESSKADFDVEIDIPGFVYYNPNITVSKYYKVGYNVAVISETELQDTDVRNLFTDESPAMQEVSEKMVSKKAEKLIAENNLDLSLFPESYITEETVRQYINHTKKNFQNIDFYYEHNAEHFFKPNHKKKLAIVGAGKAALQLIDTVYAENKYMPVVLYDNSDKIIGKKLLNIPIKKLSIENILSDSGIGLFDEIIISFSGNIKERKNWFDLLEKQGLIIANVFHPTCLRSNYIKIGKGNIFFANTRIGPFVEVGNNNVVSSYCSFEHHNLLGSHNTFGPSVVFSGSCTIGDCIKFGTGIFIEPRIMIGNDCIISSGSIIIRNIQSNKLVKTIYKTDVKDI